jgi:transposase
MTLSRPRRCAWQPRAAAQQVSSSPQLLYRWQQAQLVAEVGSVAAARDPEVRALRARLKRADQESDMFKKALVSQML